MISGTQYRVQAEVNRQRRLSNDIARLQTEISTGVRIQSASDDPAAAARVATIRQRQAEEAGWTSNVKAASATASAVDSTMSNVESAMQRVQELLILANSATTGDSDRVSIASELNGLAQDLAGYAAATDSSGQPLFPASPLAIPVGRGNAVAATPAKADVFTITAADGARVDLSSFVAAAAATVSAGGSAAAALTAAGNAGNQIADARAVQGVRASRIEAAGDRLTTSATNLEAERSDLDSTDVTRAVADLQAKMTTLEAAQALLVKLSKSNLFDSIG